MTLRSPVYRSPGREVMRLLSGIGGGRAGQLAAEPGAGEAPVALDGFRRDVENLRRFLDSQTAKIPEFYNLRLARVELLEPLQGLIQAFPAITVDRGQGCQVFVQRHALLIFAATLIALFGTGIIHQDLAHQVGRDSDKFPPILASGLLLWNKAQVNFVDQCCGLQGVSTALFAQIMMSQLPQLVVHGSDERIGDPPWQAQFRQEAWIRQVSHRRAYRTILPQYDKMLCKPIA